MKHTKSTVSYVAMATAIWGIGATSATAQDAQEDADTDSTIIEELIVTATKRAERMVDVPISMSAFGAESLEQTGIRELKDIAEFIPNLQISQHNDFRAVVTIRGVGASSRNIGFDSRVGVYVDGVYMGQSPSMNQELLDLERVEVLRGPQGMLFGKNTVAGAVSLITKKPGEEFEGKVSADFGNLNYREFKGILNVPLGDTAAAKFSIAKTDRDGYATNIVTGSKLNERDVLAYRAQLRIEASEQFEINLSIDGLDSEGKILVGDPLTDMLGWFPETNAPKFGEVAFDIDPQDNRNIFGGHVDLDYELENGYTVKSISGYRKTDANYSNATDYTPIDIISIDYTDNFKQFSEELQFISPDNEKFTYMLGLYYYTQTSDTVRDVTLGADFEDAFVGLLYNIGAFTPPLPAAPALPNSLVSTLLGFGPPLSLVYNSGRVKTKSYAAYFNGSYEVSERVRVGFGARYSIEDKDVNWLLDGRNSGIFFIGSTGADPANPTPLIDDRRDKFFAPAISLSYALGDSSNVYAKYSSGYKSGGFNLDYINADELTANPTQTFDKETVDSFEVGFKGSFLEQRLTISMAGFIANYDDYQVNQFVDLGGGSTSIRITNAAKVKTKGIEAEFTLRATPDLTFQGSLGLLDATFDSFPGGGTAGADASGNQLVNAPKLNLAFSAQYYKSIPSLKSAFVLRGDFTHASGYFTTANNDKEVPFAVAPGTVRFGYLPSRTLVHGRIGLVSENETWEAYLWGRNLTDQVDAVDGFRDFFGTIVEMPSIGRTFGAEVVWNF